MELWDSWDYLGFISNTGELGLDAVVELMWECPRCFAAVREQRRVLHQVDHGRVSSSTEPEFAPETELRYQAKWAGSFWRCGRCQSVLTGPPERDCDKCGARNVGQQQ